MPCLGIFREEKIFATRQARSERVNRPRSGTCSRCAWDVAAASVATPGTPPSKEAVQANPGAKAEALDEVSERRRIAEVQGAGRACSRSKGTMVQTST